MDLKKQSLSLTYCPSSSPVETSLQSMSGLASIVCSILSFLTDPKNLFYHFCGFTGFQGISVVKPKSCHFDYLSDKGNMHTSQTRA